MLIILTVFKVEAWGCGPETRSEKSALRARNYVHGGLAFGSRLASEPPTPPSLASRCGTDPHPHTRLQLFAPTRPRP